jgi:hypothetical protein
MSGFSAGEDFGMSEMLCSPSQTSPDLAASLKPKEGDEHNENDLDVLRFSGSLPISHFSIRAERTLPKFSVSSSMPQHPVGNLLEDRIPLRRAEMWLISIQRMSRLIMSQGREIWNRWINK